jgi:hypothetical protein
MRKVFIFFGVLIYLCLTVQSVHAEDPVKIHKADFGPKIQDLQLGKPMTWPQMLNIQRDISKGLAGAYFGMYIADNAEAVDQQNTSPGKPGKWILVNFLGGTNATIMNGDGETLSKVPKSGSLSDFFTLLKNSGLNYASTPNITLRDDRVIQYSIERSKLHSGMSTTEDFVQWFSKTYSLGAMEKKGENYESRNASEGWRAVVTDDKVLIFSVPIPDNLQ